MNASITSYDDASLSFKVDFRRVEKSAERPSFRSGRRPNHSRGKSPVSVNGIHRRRVKKIQW